MHESIVLVVDDTKEVTNSLKRALRNEPYRLEIAHSGEETLTFLSKNTCKVVVSDVKMSKMDGFELLEKVHERYPDVIRVILSGHADVKLILELVNKKGIDRYLTKPWDNKLVKWTITQCIELYDLRFEVKQLRDQLYKESIKHPL